MLTSNGYVLDERPARLGRLSPVPASERTDRPALWRRLGEQGYLFLPGHLDPALVQDFRAYYFATLAPSGLTPTTAAADGSGPGPGGAEVDRAVLRTLLFGSVVPGEAYRALCTTPAIRDWFGWFLDGEVHLHRRKIIRHVRPGEVGVGLATQAHYDLLYLRGGSDRVLSMWIPLGDCPQQRGGLVYLEGSHRRVLAAEAAGARPPAASRTADLPGLEDTQDARWLTADYAAGDVVVHCAQIVHAALDNVDDHGVVRLSTDIRYQRSDDVIDPRWQQHWHDQDGL